MEKNVFWWIKSLNLKFKYLISYCGLKMDRKVKIYNVCRTSEHLRSVIFFFLENWFYPFLKWRRIPYKLHFLYPCFFFKFSPTVMFQSKVFENISFSMFSPTRIINFYISDSQNPRWYISIIFRGSRKKSGIKFEVNRFDLPW